MKKINIIIFIITILSAILIIKPVFAIREDIKKEDKKNKILLEKIEEQKKIKEKLEKEIEQISKDENVEKIARENLNMTTKDERVYKFVENDEK